MNHRLLRNLLLPALLAGLTPLAWGWYSGGHMIITAAAVRALPDDIPAFFRQGFGDLNATRVLMHCSVDPDTFKNRDAAPQLTSAEGPEHFLDLELLKGKPLPDTRAAYIKLCYSLKLDPFTVGFLPYSITEWTQRLELAFAEHRRWPDDKAIQAKCLVYAGILAHYAGDGTQPLHVTVDHDGRADAAGKSPRSGIHGWVDGIIEHLRLTPAQVAADVHPQDLGPLLPAVIKEIQASHSLVDKVYEMRAGFPKSTKDDASPAVTAFARERAKAAATFIASLYLTAWHDSAKVELPAWQIEARNEESPIANHP